MARRTKGDEALVILAIVIGLPVFLVSKIFEVTGWIIPVSVVVAAIVLVLWSKHIKKQKRLGYLRGKYRDEVVVQKIYEGYFWHGQTEEQLVDSLGHPAAIDNKLLKTKTREVWKYHPSGTNRYRLRITVENGCVAGWDQKN
jgi:hypothetical protein